jgi:hypothetical protein
LWCSSQSVLGQPWWFVSTKLDSYVILYNSVNAVHVVTYGRGLSCLRVHSIVDCIPSAMLKLHTISLYAPVLRFIESLIPSLLTYMLLQLNRPSSPVIPSCCLSTICIFHQNIPTCARPMPIQHWYSSTQGHDNRTLHVCFARMGSMFSMVPIWVQVLGNATLFACRVPSICRNAQQVVADGV